MNPDLLSAVPGPSALRRPLVECTAVARAQTALALACVALSVGDYRTTAARMRAAKDAIDIALWRINHEIECGTQP